MAPPKLRVMKKRKSWREKLERPQERKIIATPKGRMLIPKPTDINEVVKVIEKGKLVTDAQIREYLAKKYGADYTCPMTAGIFLRIVSEAAEEDLKKGVKEIAPYWRVVRKDGSLIDKFPGGVEAQATRLEEEGHTIIWVGRKKKPKVAGFQKAIQTLLD